MKRLNVANELAMKHTKNPPKNALMMIRSAQIKVANQAVSTPLSHASTAMVNAVHGVCLGARNQKRVFAVVGGYVIGWRGIFRF